MNGIMGHPKLQKNRQFLLRSTVTVLQIKKGTLFSNKPHDRNQCKNRKRKEEEEIGNEGKQQTTHTIPVCVYKSVRTKRNACT